MIFFIYILGRNNYTDYPWSSKTAFTKSHQKLFSQLSMSKILLRSSWDHKLELLGNLEQFHEKNIYFSFKIFTWNYKFPPIFSEDDPVGTNVLTIKARDGDSGQARRIIYTLEENPNGYFAIDKDKGDITIDKPINRWVSSGLLKNNQSM